MLLACPLVKVDEGRGTLIELKDKPDEEGIKPPAVLENPRLSVELVPTGGGQ